MKPMQTSDRGAGAPFLAQRRPLSHFAWGFSLPLRAGKLILDSPFLRKWSAAAVAISLVLLASLVVVLLLGTGSVLGLIWPKPESWWLLLWFPLAALLFSLLFVAGASTLPTIATAPLLDLLSEEAERLLGGELPVESGVAKVVRETIASVLKAVIRVSILLAGYLILLFLWLIPGIGQVIWTGGSVLWTIFWIAFEYLDVVANRHDYRFREVARVVADHGSASLGFGAALYLMLLVPLLNVVFIPVGAVGATIYFVELRHSGRLPASERERRLSTTGLSTRVQAGEREIE